MHDAQLTAAKAPPAAAPPPQPPAIDAAEIIQLRKEHKEEVDALSAQVAKLRREVEAAAGCEQSGVENAMNLADKEKKKLVDAADAERRKFGDERKGLKVGGCTS